MDGIINAAIVGYGFAGRCFHAYLIDRTEGLNLYAVASRDRERRARAHADYGVRTYATLEELLGDDGVDLVVVATPHDVHAQLAIQAMDAGKHVVVDKVMCMNAREADEMIRARDRNNVILSVFHNRRWDGDYLTVRKVLSEGLIGTPFLFEVGIVRYRCPGGWRSQKAHMGGLLFDWGAHLVDQALQLVDAEVETVFCDAQYRKWDVDIESHVKLLIRFRNGVLYGVEVSNLARADKPRWYVLGELGALTKTGLDPQEAAMIAGNIDAAVEDPAHYARVATEIRGTPCDMRVPTLRGDWPAYYRNIAEVLLRGTELAVRPEEVRRDMLVIDAAMRSAETGMSVRLG